MAMTAKDLIAKKTDILAQKNAEIDIDIEGVGVWRFRTPTAEDFIDGEKYAEAHKNEVRNSDPVIIYNCVVEPNLRDAELEAAFSPDPEKPKSQGPWIIYELLKTGQVSRVGALLAKQAGFSATSANVVVEEAIVEGAEQVKNS